MTEMVPTLPHARLCSATLVLALFLVIVPVHPVWADVEWDPGDFIKDLSDRAIHQLTDESTSQEEKEQRFRALMNEGFDIGAIGKFVLGRYWPRASQSQRQDFMAAFESMIVFRFLPLFSQYSGETIRVGLIRQFSENPNFFNVTTRLEKEGNEPIQVDWRVRKVRARYKVVDVIAEGVSYAVTLRSEYASVLKQNGGDVRALVQTMREASASL